MDRWITLLMAFLTVALTLRSLVFSRGKSLHCNMLYVSELDGNEEHSRRRVWRPELLLTNFVLRYTIVHMDLQRKQALATDEYSHPEGTRKVLSGKSRLQTERRHDPLWPKESHAY